MLKLRIVPVSALPFLFHIAHGAGVVFAGPLTRAVTRLFGSRRALLRAASFNINPAFCL